MTAGFKGGCLCGAIRFESKADPQFAGHCHCVDCRKSSGTGHCTHLLVPDADFTLTGKVTVYAAAADSGNIVSRSFCGVCGSPVFSTNSAKPGAVFVRASVLDDPEIAKPQANVYASRAVSWDRMDTSLPTFATMPPGGPNITK